MNEPKVTIQGQSIIIEREVDAPAELVWQAFTKPDLVAQWWGPEGFTNTISEMEVRVGGKWTLVMHGPDGRDYPNQIIYDEIKKPARLAFHHQASPEMNLQGFKTIINFIGQNGKTVVVLHNEFASPEEAEKQIKLVGAVEGGKQTLNRLANFLLHQ